MIDLKKNISNKAMIGGIVSALFICGLFVGIGYIQYRTAKNETHVVIVPPVNYFAQIKIEAKAAIVYDVRDKKIIYQKNSNASLPLASITKVMTALVANDVLSATDTVAIDQSSLDVEGEDGFTPNQPWKFSDLLNFTLLTSSNDGAHAIANAASAVEGINFPQQMNETAQELGLTSMKFHNENGLDIPDIAKSGGYGSATDVAKLFAHIITTEPSLLEITKNATWNFRALDNTLYQAENTDPLVNKIPGLLASKTGYTIMAGGNLGVAFDAGLNHPVVVIVLGSSWDGRFTDLQTLAKAAVKNIKQ